ncbi:MAG: S9 family peptidase, partial [Actinobacteria bacterium]
EYLEAENHFTREATAHTAALQRAIFDEIKRRTQETDLSVPAQRGRYWYATRTVEGLPYRIWVRREGAPDGPEQVMLDENAEAEGHGYLQTANVTVSPDDRIVAYSLDTTGSERYLTRFRVVGGEDLPDEIPDTYYGSAWAADSEHFFYTVVKDDGTMRPWQVWRHRLGVDPAAAVLVYQEDDDRFYLDLQRSRSGDYVLITAESAVTSEVRFIPTADPSAPPVPILPRVHGVLYDADHRLGDFWVVTDDGAPDGKLLRFPVAGGTAVEVVPHVAGTKLGRVEAFAGHVIVWGRRAGLPAALVVADEGEPAWLEMDEEVYELAPAANLEFDTSQLRYRFESPVTPASIYDHDVVSGERTLLKRTPVLGGYDPSHYVARRVWAEARDGALVPVSVVRHRDTAIDGSAPLLVYAYGAYEASVPAGFSIPRLSVLDRGVVYAIAHVRGGGEMGRDWYEKGKLGHKTNTFTDLIDAVAQLTAAGFGDPHRVAIRGASAGGLTVGVALTMDPGRFRAVVAEVPFVDVVNTMLDAGLPLTIIEWEEWGNPNDPEQYGWLAGYSPYENVPDAPLPAILATAGLNDPRVQYWEPAKWVAKLRTAGKGDRAILLKTEMGAGHFARSSRYETWEDEAFVLAFILDQLGVGD